MHPRSALAGALLLAAAGVSLAGCGEARNAAESGGASAACTFCHGTPGRTGNLPGTDPDLPAAPPALPVGAPASAVGAHEAHVNPPATGALRGPLPCSECHDPTPTTLAHASKPPPQPVSFGTLARTAPASPSYAGAAPAPTCSAVYCHGAFSFDGGDPAGPYGGQVVGNSFAPTWTGGASQAACGTCHDLPPKGHLVLSPNLGPLPYAPQVCAGCHPMTVLPSGAIDVSAANSPGTHANGQVDEGAHPDPSWCVLSGNFGSAAGCAPESPGNPRGGLHGRAALDFTPPSTGLAACLKCHSVGGVAYGSAEGEATSSCNDCHTAAGVPNWLSSCTFCHGTPGRTGNFPGTDANLAAAPPFGVQGETSSSQVAVGAHQAHVNPTAGAALASPFSCTQCHNPMPPAAPHPSGATSLVAFGGLAAAGPTAPSWNPTAATCAATYCHGNYSGDFAYTFYGDPRTASYAGKNATATWTSGPMTCGSCHGNPPTIPGMSQSYVWHSGSHGGGNNCDLCHPDANATGTAITNLALHVNGVVDVQATFVTSCFGCH